MANFEKQHLLQAKNRDLAAQFSAALSAQGAELILSMGVTAEGKIRVTANGDFPADKLKQAIREMLISLGG